MTKPHRRTKANYVATRKFDLIQQSEFWWGMKERWLTSFAPCSPVSLNPCYLQSTHFVDNWINLSWMLYHQLSVFRQFQFSISFILSSTRLSLRNFHFTVIKLLLIRLRGLLEHEIMAVIPIQHLLLGSFPSLVRVIMFESITIKSFTMHFCFSFNETFPLWL